MPGATACAALWLLGDGRLHWLLTVALRSFHSSLGGSKGWLVTPWATFLQHGCKSRWVWDTTWRIFRASISQNLRQLNPETFIRRTDAEAEAPILCPPGEKTWLIGKDSDVGKDWGQEKKGMTEDETVGWHQGLNGHEFEQTLEVGNGQGSLVWCSPWGRRVRHESVTKHSTAQREGTYVQLWLIHADVWQKTTKFCKAIILKLKNKYLKKNSQLVWRFLKVLFSASTLKHCSWLAGNRMKI